MILRATSTVPYRTVPYRTVRTERMKSCGAPSHCRSHHHCALLPAPRACLPAARGIDRVSRLSASPPWSKVQRVNLRSTGLTGYEINLQNFNEFEITTNFCSSSSTLTFVLLSLYQQRQNIRISSADKAWCTSSVLVAAVLLLSSIRRCPPPCCCSSCSSSTKPRRQGRRGAALHHALIDVGITQIVTQTSGSVHQIGIVPKGFLGGTTATRRGGGRYPRRPLFHRQ
jgi:hypothetical protein